MYKNKSISLILPCRNEQKAIAYLLKNTPRYIDEIIVVDNLSTDKTVSVSKKLGAQVIIEPRHDHKIGYGYALATGIKNAKGDYIICMDGDGSYPIGKISEGIKFLNKQNLNFLSCNRLPVLEHKKMSVIRNSGVKILNFCMFMLFGYPIKDCLSGMWIFKKEAVNFLDLREGGWNLSLEIKINAISNPQINFGEFHIPYKDREFDQSKQNLFKTGVTHLLYLFEKRFSFFLWYIKSSKPSLLD